MKVTYWEPSEDNQPPSVTYHVEDEDGEQVRQIVFNIVPPILELFAQKNRDYDDGTGGAFTLGVRGQFSDIYRKVIKLKRAMWDEQELEFEGTDEILRDLIGHCFLTLLMRQKDVDEDSVEAAIRDAEAKLAALGGPGVDRAEDGCAVLLPGTRDSADADPITRPPTSDEHAQMHHPLIRVSQTAEDWSMLQRAKVEDKLASLPAPEGATRAEEPTPSPEDQPEEISRYAHSEGQPGADPDHIEWREREARFRSSLPSVAPSHWIVSNPDETFSAGDRVRFVQALNVGKVHKVEAVGSAGVLLEGKEGFWNAAFLTKQGVLQDGQVRLRPWVHWDPFNGGAWIVNTPSPLGSYTAERIVNGAPVRFRNQDHPIVYTVDSVNARGVYLQGFPTMVFARDLTLADD